MVEIINKMSSPEYLAFPCTQCGLCCQNVHLAEETQFLDRGDGICRHYDATSKLCSIYQERPDICRVDRMYAMRYQKEYAWETFVALNQQVCTALQMQACASATKKIL